VTPNEIKAELVRKGISMTAIADETGTSVQEVSMCIRGNGIYQKIRKRIAKKLGRKVSDIFASHHPQPKGTSRWCKAA
jgi:lambda repressor-like predicted transcriptional regulator